LSRDAEGEDFKANVARRAGVEIVGCYSFGIDNELPGVKGRLNVALKVEVLNLLSLLRWIAVEEKKGLVRMEQVYDFWN